MIFFVTTERNRKTIDRYLASWGRDQLGRTQVFSYDRFLELRRFSPGAYVFGDLEQLTETQRCGVTECWEQLDGKPGYQLLNHPVRSLRCLELLTRIHELGSKRFGICPPLLEPDDDGRFRRYSAFCVGGNVIARQLLFTPDGSGADAVDAESEQVAEELEYLETNPHKQDLAEIFRFARIDYGRLDYVVMDEKLLVWRLHTNPTILHANHAEAGPRHEAHQIFDVRFSLAWNRLAVGPDGDTKLEDRAVTFYRAARESLSTSGLTRSWLGQHLLDWARRVRLKLQ